MKGFRRSGLFVMLAVFVLTTGMPTASWSQAPSPSEASASDSAVSDATAGISAVLGSIIYLPFKVLVICPGMALASGATYVFAGGHSEVTEHLLRVGCTGSYGAAPGMVQGRQEFLGGGKESAVRAR